MKLKIAVAGNPNSGKTTLFNSIAGTNYRVANYPGVTVEKKSADIEYKNTKINLTDLPGTYSLSTYSLEEKVARNFIINNKPDCILQVIDASNIERNLYLTIQLLELNIPVIIALNMVDVAKKRGLSINAELLSQRFRVPVIETIARQNIGMNELLDTIINYQDSNQININEFSYGSDINQTLDILIDELDKSNFSINNLSNKYISLKYLEKDDGICTKIRKDKNVSEQFYLNVEKLQKHTKETLNTDVEFVISDHRYGIVSTILKDVIKQTSSNLDRVFFSDKIDKVLTHKFLGPLLLISILYFSYQFTFWASEAPVGWLESFFEYLAGIADANLSDGLLKSLIISGIIEGAGGVLGFTPLILFMFFMIAILEDTGYMARIAYMLDRVFRIFGLQGSSALPYIVSGGIAGGCAVPGVMATRAIKGTRERILTMITSPFMLCGAKLPVFSLLIAAFFPGKEALLLLAFTFVGWISALLLAKLFGETIIKGEASSFLMELPPYRMPTLKGLILHSWEKTWMYIKKAGTIILAISTLLWVLMTFPKLPEQELTKFKEMKSKTLNEKELLVIKNLESQTALKYSLAGRVGTFLEPVTKYAGFDWRTNIALIGGIAAKEVVVSALGTAYSIGEVDVDDSLVLSEQLASDPKWNVGVAISLILFILFYAPCFITVVVISKESGSWKWGAFTAISYTLFAFLLSSIFYSTYSLYITGAIVNEDILLGAILFTAFLYLARLLWKKIGMLNNHSVNNAVCSGCSSSDCHSENMD